MKSNDNNNNDDDADDDYTSIMIITNITPPTAILCYVSCSPKKRNVDWDYWNQYINTQCDNFLVEVGLKRGHVVKQAHVV